MDGIQIMDADCVGNNEKRTEFFRRVNTVTMRVRLELETTFQSANLISRAQSRRSNEFDAWLIDEISKLSRNDRGVEHAKPQSEYNEQSGRLRIRRRKWHESDSAQRSRDQH